MATNYPPPVGPGAPPPKKKTSPLVIVLAIVGGLMALLVIGVVAGGLFIVNKVKQAGFDPDEWRDNPGVAAAKMITAMNPDAEVVRVDEDRGVVVIREKSSGKTITMNFEDIKQGRLTFSDSEGGSVTVGGGADLPSWVPLYPGAKPEGGLAATNSKEGSGGAFSFTSSDSPATVIQQYRSTLENAGFTVEAHNSSDSGGILIGKDEGNSRSVTATVSSSGNQTTVSVIYAEKNQ